MLQLHLLRRLFHHLHYLNHYFDRDPLVSPQVFGVTCSFNSIAMFAHLHVNNILLGNILLDDIKYNFDEVTDWSNTMRERLLLNC